STMIGPNTWFVRCGCAGNVCTGCDPTSMIAVGFTDTVIVIGVDQLVDPPVASTKRTFAGWVAVAAVKRASLEVTMVLPSVRMPTVTSAVGAFVRRSVYVSG